MESEDRQAAWYRAVRDGVPRGKHYGEPLKEEPAEEGAAPDAEANVGDASVVPWDAEEEPQE